MQLKKPIEICSTTTAQQEIYAQGDRNINPHLIPLIDHYLPTLES